MSDGKEVANQSAMQVQNLKQNLNEWKYVITAADAVLNTADPMKSAAAHAGLYTSVYVLFLITNVSSILIITVNLETKLGNIMINLETPLLSWKHDLMFPSCICCFRVNTGGSK